MLHIHPENGAFGLDHCVELGGVLLGPVAEDYVDQGPAVNVADFDDIGPAGIVKLVVALENLVQSVFEIARPDHRLSLGLRALS